MFRNTQNDLPNITRLKPLEFIPEIYIKLLKYIFIYWNLINVDNIIYPQDVYYEKFLWILFYLHVVSLILINRFGLFSGLSQPQIINLEITFCVGLFTKMLNLAIKIQGIPSLKTRN